MNILDKVFKKINSKESTVEVHSATEEPLTVWRELFTSPNGRVCRTVEPKPHDAPRDKDTVRFVCISDTHNKLGNILDSIPEGDVLIHAGDFTYRGQIHEVVEFNKCLAKLPHKYKVIIAGNHELTFDPETNKDNEEQLRKYGVNNPRELLTDCIYLEDSFCELFGYKIYGSPWQPEFGGWAFNVPRGQLLLDKWNCIPDDTDILITHGPALGHGDLTTYTRTRAGCVELLNTIEQRVKPLYHVCGHIHEGHGITTNDHTIFINASVCDLRYKPSQKPIIFDLPLKKNTSNNHKL